MAELRGAGGHASLIAHWTGGVRFLFYMAAMEAASSSALLSRLHLLLRMLPSSSLPRGIGERNAVRGGRCISYLGMPLLGRGGSHLLPTSLPSSDERRG